MSYKPGTCLACDWGMQTTELSQNPSYAFAAGWYHAMRWLFVVAEAEKERGGKLEGWAPRPKLCEEHAQFILETGFVGSEKESYLVTALTPKLEIRDGIAIGAPKKGARNARRKTRAH